MKRHTFKNEDDYVRAQVNLVRTKLERQKNKPDQPLCWVRPDIISVIQAIHTMPVYTGVCQGVRLGFELEFFIEAFGATGDWWGTEIVEELCDGGGILHHNFNHPLPEQVGPVDLMYTNSFDHSQDPWKTAEVWLEALSFTGRLYVEWSKWHNKLGSGRNRADCFAASADEYRDLFNQVGTVDVEVVIKRTKSHPYPIHLFCVRSK